jgi:hypothetical protein
MRVIAYTYEADHHCLDCTVERFQYDKQDWTDWNFTAIDENGIYIGQKDKEGNSVHPVFSTDEWQEFDSFFLAENPIQYLVCGDCHTIIDEYTDWRNWYE